MENAQINYYPMFYSQKEAKDLYTMLLRDIPFKSDEIKIFGRKMVIPRLQCWMGEKDAVYSYSGLKMVPEPWDQLVFEIKENIEQTTGEEFNSVLINLYRDGQDSNGWHSDDEKELGPKPFIASLSLGESRLFQMKHRLTGAREDILLESGSLLTMADETQKYWKHQIAKSKKIVLPRINLTFRKIFY